MPRIALCACLLLGGCFLENASSGKRLNDALREMNKATRWGQLGLAAQMVVPIYRKQFMANHAHWGKHIQLANSEILHVQMGEGNENAVAVVAYEWYLLDTMTLHQSVVRQRWTKAGNGYALLSEVVMQGDGRLLDPDAGREGGTAVMRDPMVGSLE